MLPAFAHIHAWIFYLDNTLYPASADLFGLMDVRMTAYVARTLGIGDLVEARRILLMSSLVCVALPEPSVPSMTKNRPFIAVSFLRLSVKDHLRSSAASFTRCFASASPRLQK